MKNIQLKVEYNEDKIKAMKVSLKEKNKDFDEEILKFLDGLYNKNVPKLLKKFIEIGLEPEARINDDVGEVKKEQLNKFNTALVNNRK